MRANIVWTVGNLLKSITAAAWLERSLAGPRTLVRIKAQRK